METCRHCGQPLILKDGVCFFCQKAPGEEPMKRGEESSIGKKAPLGAEPAAIPKVKERRPIDRDSKRKRIKGKAIQVILLIILLIETTFAGIAEFSINVGWGIATTFLVNAPCVGMAFEMISMSNEGLFVHDKKRWRRLHEYYHFPIKMVAVALGVLILLLVQNFWTIVLDLLLGIIIVFMDTQLEELFE